MLKAARGGAAEAAGFIVSTGNNIVIGFALAGTAISAGEAVLVILDVAGPRDACVTDLVISDLVISDSVSKSMDAACEDFLTISTDA